jgi:head-tail adaptor
MNAGDYPYRLQWLQCVRTTDNTTGDAPKTYTSNGYLWGSVDLQSSNSQTDYGAVRNQASGTIKLRNFPNIVGSDRLFSSLYNQTFVIDGVRKDFENNQMVLEVHSLEMD